MAFEQSFDNNFIAQHTISEFILMIHDHDL